MLSSGLFRETEAPLAPSSPLKLPGVEAFSALRRRPSLREVEAPTVSPSPVCAPRGVGVSCLFSFAFVSLDLF